MTAPERRRPLPALAFIAALTVLTALVWFRVIHRNDSAGAEKPACTPTRTAAPAALKVLPVPSKVTVAVLNSTQRNGVATSTKKLLKAKTFKVSIAENDDPRYGGHGLIKGTGEIRYGPAAKPGATLLRYYLPSATMVPTDSSTSTVILALGAKFKGFRTIAQARKAIAAAGITLTKGTVPTPKPAATTATPTCSPTSTSTSSPGGTSSSPSN